MTNFMGAIMTSRKTEGRLEHIDVVRLQDGEIHVLGRGEEIISVTSHQFETTFRVVIPT